MKAQDEMRSKFEQLEDVKNRLSQGGVYWDGKKYSTLPFMNSFVYTAIFLNGAWYAFQEQQKQIDKMNSLISDLWTELDDRNSKEHIIDKCEPIIKELLK